MRRASERLESERLLGLKISEGDLGDFQSYYTDPLAMRSLSVTGEPWDPGAAAELFEQHLLHWSEHGYGTWMFRDPENGTFLGRGGLRCVDVGRGPEVELFYGVASDAWGNGLATEMAIRIIDVAFGDLGLDRLIAFTLPTNRASRRVLEKCGFEPDGEITHQGLLHLLFRLSARP